MQTRKLLSFGVWPGSKYVSILFGTVILVQLAACTGSKKEVRAPLHQRPTVAVFNLSSAPNLNPDLDGRPSPVVLRLYELKSLARFESADYFTLSTADAAALGPEVLAIDTIMVKPGEARIWKRQLQPETRYLGVTSAFRDLESADWRSQVRVLPNNATEVNVALEKIKVSIANHPEATIPGAE